MIYTIPGRIKDDIFHKLGNSTNGFVFLIIFRRKWLITNQYLSEEKAIELFPSSEMCFGKCLIPGDATDDKIDYKVNQLLSVMTDCVEKKMTFKGISCSLESIYRSYPEAISLMFTFPRDLIKATKRLVKKSIDVLFSNDMDRIIRMSQHYDQEWISVCQSTADRNYIYGFIDIDYDIVSKYNLIVIRNRLFEFAKQIGLTIMYAVTTVSGGLHIIVELNDHTRRILFAKSDNLVCKLLMDLFEGIQENMIEIGTTSNKITHLPFNSNVDVLISDSRIVF